MATRESYEQTVISGEVAERLSPQPSRAYVVKPGRLPVSEFALDRPGASSPFGDDLHFPLPLERLTYVHPTDDASPLAH
jgi:succinate dehydrogenase / fumarate reductase iron-sulfur subunit